jgi:hypothetical protein
VPPGSRKAIPPLELAVGKRQVKAATRPEPPAIDCVEQVTQEKSVKLRVFHSEMWVVEDNYVGFELIPRPRVGAFIRDVVLDSVDAVADRNDHSAMTWTRSGISIQRATKKSFQNGIGVSVLGCELTNRVDTGRYQLNDTLVLFLSIFSFEICALGLEPAS